MALGQAAGVAAHLAIEAGVPPRAVPADRLQRTLLWLRQVITCFKDINQADLAYAALQYYGARGFFPDYFARSKDALDAATAAEWWHIATGSSRAGGQGLLSRRTLRSWLAESGAAAMVESGDGDVTRGELCMVASLGRHAAVARSPRHVRAMLTCVQCSSPP